MIKHLKLQDNAHTAKLLEHKHTSYRGLLIVMLVFGVCLILAGRSAFADDYIVNAKVAAPMPTIAAEITSPLSDTTVSDKKIIISGICPIVSPAVVVVLYNSTSLLGSAGCSADGQFSGTFSL
jgi:hypothetical protein